MIEPLEPRIAPALVFPNGKGFTYTDIDGDFVTVKFSKPLVQIPIIRDAVTIFAGGPNWGQNTTPENLLTLDLTKASDVALIDGLDVTITAQQRGTGDGYVHMFGIASRNAMPAIGDVFSDLGKVKVDGWLNFFSAGDGNATLAEQAVKSLEVQGLGDQFENQLVRILGSVGSLIVKGNVTADIDIGPPLGFTFNEVSVGKIWIGGSVTAGAQGSGGTLSVIAKATSSIYIGGNVQGGTQPNSGVVSVNTGLAKNVTVRGSIVGGDGDDSGSVSAYASRLTVSGSVIGGGGLGSGALTGLVTESSPTGHIVLHGSVLGGAGDRSGSVTGFGGKGSSLTIGGDVATALNPSSGFVLYSPFGAVGKITVGGSLINRVESVFSTAGAVTRAGGSIHLFSLPGAGAGSVDLITVGGTLRGGNIAANVLAGVDGYFGTADDVRETAGATIRLAKVVVKGGVEQVNTAGFFGVVANDLKAVQLGRLTLTDATANYAAGVSIGNYVRVREI